MSLSKLVYLIYTIYYMIIDLKYGVGKEIKGGKSYIIQNTKWELIIRFALVVISKPYGIIDGSTKIIKQGPKI